MEPKGPPAEDRARGQEASESGLAHLAMASTELGAAMGPTETVESVLALSTGLNGSTDAAVFLRHGSGVSARISRSGRIEQTEYASVEEVPRGALRSSLESGRPSWHIGHHGLPPDARRPGARRPRVAQLVPEEVLGPVALAIGHPIRDGAGDVVGALAIGWAEAPFDSPEVRATAELFCELAETSLVRAFRTGELNDLAEQLREALLPTGNSHVELDVAFDYVPAMDAIGFGGDWFDCVDRSDHSVVLVVGDVAGHGVQAAARMALVQGAVRGLALSVAVERIPYLASRALTGERAELVATLGLLKVDLAEMTVSCELAGHPPPMLRHPGGAVERLGGRPGPPIGMVDEPMARAEPSPLSEGCLLVLYSDGLIERRDCDLDGRLDTLEAVIAALGEDLDAETALGEICDQMLTDASEDDVAILVARIAGPASTGAASAEP